MLWDQQSCIPLSNILDGEDIIALLTPVVVPLDNTSTTKDPFEPLGRALAARHARVRHVPYTKRGGITSTHVAFIKRARVVIFVISGPPGPGETNQIELAEVTRIIADHRPQIIVACFSIHPQQLPGTTFPTIVQISSYSTPDLEAAASLLFGRDTSGPALTLRPPEPAPPPRHWTVHVWDPDRDMAEVHELWGQCLPLDFQLSTYALKSILKRDGFAMHYTVRDPETRKLVGFCATYTTFADSAAENLVASLAVLFVRLEYRGRGIGRSLHDHAMHQLKKPRGVVRFQLGSTFPRLLYGLPSNHPAAGWFRRRGWEVDQPLPGKGQEVCDWLLNFDDSPSRSFSSAGLVFRPCTDMEMPEVLDIVTRESARNEGMGWYDQYFNLKDTPHTQDIILGLEGDAIVATALTYIPNSGSQVSRDLPWAQTIGLDVGGVACICITGR